MIKAFYNGISGIKTQSFGIDVWANNISNINTTGFRASTPEFKSIFDSYLPQSVFNLGQDEVGSGAFKQTTALNFQEGTYQNTDNKFDLSILGSGFFGLRGLDGEIYYSRAGAFNIDSAGNLTDPGGRILQGKLNLENLENKELNIQEGEQENIKLPQSLSVKARPTTEINIFGELANDVKFDFQELKIPEDSYQFLIGDDDKIKLDAKFDELKKGDEVRLKYKDENGKIVEIKDIVKENGIFSIEGLNPDIKNLNPELSFFTKSQKFNEASSSVKIINQNGEEDVLNLKFKQSKDPLKWDVQVDVQGEIKKGELSFDVNGKIIDSTLSDIAGIKLNFSNNDDSNYNGLNLGRNSQLQIKTDGQRGGVLKDYEVSNNNILAIFDNGDSFPVAKIALYNFRNSQGLHSIGNSLFAKTSNSGEPFFFTNENQEIIQPAKIRSRSLESSNVNLSSALTQLIIIQKAYDASSKSVSTGDEMLKTALAMKV